MVKIYAIRYAFDNDTYHKHTIGQLLPYSPLTPTKQDPTALIFNQ